MFTREYLPKFNEGCQSSLGDPQTHLYKIFFKTSLNKTDPHTQLHTKFI